MRENKGLKYFYEIKYLTALKEFGGRDITLEVKNELIMKIEELNYIAKKEKWIRIKKKKYKEELFEADDELNFEEIMNIELKIFRDSIPYDQVIINEEILKKLAGE